MASVMPIAFVPSSACSDCGGIFALQDQSHRFRSGRPGGIFRGDFKHAGSCPLILKFTNQFDELRRASNLVAVS